MKAIPPTDGLFEALINGSKCQKVPSLNSHADVLAAVLHKVDDVVTLSENLSLPEQVAVTALVV